MSPLEVSSGLLPLVAIGQIVGILELRLLLLGLADLVAVRGGVHVLDRGIRLQGPLPIASRLAPIFPMVLVMVLMVGMFNVYNLVRKYAKRVP